MEFAFRDDPQQTGLHLHRHVADLVEKQRPAIGLLEAPDAAPGGAGERTLLVAEQFRFYEFSGNRGDIQRYELPVRPRAVPVQGLEGAVQALVRLVARAGGDPIPDELRVPQSARLTSADARPVAAANDDGVTPGARSVGTREVEAAAGGGAVNLDEAPVKGPVWFRRDWLDGQGIDPTRCMVISVRGESMEPTLPAGSKILVDRDRTRRRAGRIFVVTTDEGLVVKRLERRGRQWFLTSDHPSWKPLPWPREAEVIGEVRWASRTFE